MKLVPGFPSGFWPPFDVPSTPLGEHAQARLFPWGKGLSGEINGVTIYEIISGVVDEQVRVEKDLSAHGPHPD